MKQENYINLKLTYRNFLIRNIENGKLVNRNIEKIYIEFYKPSDGK